MSQKYKKQTWNPPTAIVTVHSIGGLGLNTVFAKENMTNGNHIMKIIATSSTPPNPYLIRALFLNPLGVGYF